MRLLCAAFHQNRGGLLDLNNTLAIWNHHQALMAMALTTLPSLTSPVTTDESTTDDMFVFGDFLDNDDEGFFDGFTEFTCSVFSIFC